MTTAAAVKALMLVASCDVSSAFVAVLHASPQIKASVALTSDFHARSMKDSRSWLGPPQMMGSYVRCRQSVRSREPDTEDSYLLQSQLRAIFLSQSLSLFADKMWDFAIPFFLLALNRADSTSFALIYALVTGVANIAGCPIVRYFTEKYSRMETITFCLWLQISLVVSSLLLLRLAFFLQTYSVLLFYLMVSLVTVTCSLASLASFASNFAVERDWLKCLTGRNEEKLQQSDLILRRITLVCRVLAPISVGFLLASFSAQVAAAGIAFWTLVSTCIEYSLLRDVYLTSPNLSLPRTRPFSKHDAFGRSPQVEGRRGGEILSPTQTLVRVRGRQRWWLAYKASWREYMDLDGWTLLAACVF
ncbi:hypothetical protein GUITHDRAFT_99279 [Guillardia theta CCMP2712]|uniref:Solute carrier family 40 member n=1 Tax=Guillardia theta (strain CCMP2712) TaxID=905079 RepID=L1K4H4_GUITC|nr:hypothetical protein GUITHDRAFT_99279 [Guillardia theta CCMP2712]EKX55504.1 hypothetical protein GUITHDRAFT_99279 [Guillardia theta CCMP2712]|eukprot:XP_005842484.1 hypothetical protein GUITHDRAFT_99279 [Guillardia theta CCMP2712]